MEPLWFNSLLTIELRSFLVSGSPFRGPVKKEVMQHKMFNGFLILPLRTYVAWASKSPISSCIVLQFGQLNGNRILRTQLNSERPKEKKTDCQLEIGRSNISSLQERTLASTSSRTHIIFLSHAIGRLPMLTAVRMLLARLSWVWERRLSRAWEIRGV